MKGSNPTGFAAELDMCGTAYLSDFRWTCNSNPPATNDWLNPAFNDPSWIAAAQLGANTDVSGISPNAQFITSSDASKQDTAIYCRAVFPNPTFNSKLVLEGLQQATA